MADRPFYAPDSTHNARRFHLRVDDAVLVGPSECQFLMGGVGLGSAITALEQASGLRIRCLRPTRWCLLDARIQGLGAGFFHGEACIFAEDGTLLATASQSGALPKQGR